MAAPQRFQKGRVANFPTFLSFYSASQLDGNPAFTMHAECYIAHAFRTTIKLAQCCYQGCAEGDERGDAPGHSRQYVIQWVKLQKVHSSPSC